MNEYPKIQGLYKRYLEGNNKGKFIIGEYSCPEFELLKDITWVWTEKVDGCNIRVIFDGLKEKIEFKGRTDRAEIPKHLLLYLQQKIKLEDLKKIFKEDDRDYFPQICLYGEGYGYKIQSGGCNYFSGEKLVDFILFDVKIGNMWLRRCSIEKIAEQLKIKVVPIVGEGTIAEGIEFIKKGFYSTFGNRDFLAEGIVLKPKVELLDRRGHRIITKIKYKDFIN